MKIGMNPIYEKEVKLRVRSVKFALTIFFYNLILIFLALFGFEISFNLRWNSSVDYSNASKVYFLMISLEMMMVMFLIPSFTAGSIAGEREKQTLDLLLTTVLKPSQIIIGKLMSSISMVLLLVVSSLPVISIVFTIGGVQIFDLLQFMIAVLVCSLFIGSMGMLGSAMIKKTVPATVFAFGEIIIVCVGTVAIAVIVYLTSQLYYFSGSETASLADGPNVSGVLWLLLINPAFTMFEMMFRQYDGSSVIDNLVTIFGGHMPACVVEHWCTLSFIVQMLFTVFFIWLAARFIDPLRCKKGKHLVRKGTK